MIVARLLGREVLAVGSPELDETDVEMCDSTAGSFELADPELAERDHDDYRASKRLRPANGSRQKRAAS